MKPNEQGAAPLPRRGGQSRYAHKTLRTVALPEKFMGKKKAGRCTEADEHRPVAGAPEIAHPDDDEKWELQTASFTAFLFEMWERVEARNKKASRAARAELQEFLLNSLGQSLRVALDDKDSIAKQWASKLLSDIFVSIGKHLRNDSTRVAQILNKSFVEN